MRLPVIYAARGQSVTRRLQDPVGRGRERPEQIAPQAQQGVQECQMQCQEMYPDNPTEQLECYKRECW